MAGPVIAGVIWSLWGAPVLLVVRAVMAGVAELYALRVERRLPGADHAATASSAGAAAATPSAHPAGSGANR